MKLSFSLKGKEKAADKPVGAAPSLKRPAAFAGLDDDEPDTPAADAKKAAPGNATLIAQSTGLSKAAKKRMEQEQQVDSTVFQYDEVWDNIQIAKEKQKALKSQENADRKPKHIGNFLAAAETRRLDRLRAEEKMIQREREKEGDEFADKEAFVTQAYKDQQAEVRRAEEEEKKREEAEKKKRPGVSGMAYFYSKMLEETEQAHDVVVASAEPAPPPTRTTAPGAIKGPHIPPNLIITRPPDMTQKSDAELARLAQQEGKAVELNDDNQIVDKRQLLSAGLNLAAPNTRKLGLRTAMARDGGDAPAAAVYTGVGTSASRKEVDARRRREVEEQIELEKERVRAERERAEKERTARIVERRNDDNSIQSAAERYRERKRRKLEAEAAAKAAGGGEAV
ncbi:hypothetical protein PENSPDRAFT_582681 [Peniophora sp. CONT]|nr:hypothetical protein PENSPDRAFT_582681 [Peniophora sp. CONT]